MTTPLYIKVAWLNLLLATGFMLSGVANGLGIEKFAGLLFLDVGILVFVYVVASMENRDNG